MTPPNLPSIQVHPDLSITETAALVQSSQDPADFVALVGDCVSMQVSLTQQQGVRMLALTATVLIDADTLPLEISAVLNAQGQPEVSAAIRRALGSVPPMLRVVVRRSALGSKVKQQIIRAQMLRPSLSSEDPCK